MRAAGVLVALLIGCASRAEGAGVVVPSAPPDCGSVVIIRCDPPPASVDARPEAARRLEERRMSSAAMMDRIIIEEDAMRPASPESVISRALSTPFVKPGEHSFSIGEGAQCTCRNICPPWPLPCCNCTDQVGSRHATAPGSKPTN
jgi:hypothetical protein